MLNRVVFRGGYAYATDGAAAVRLKLDNSPGFDMPERYPADRIDEMIAESVKAPSVVIRRYDPDVACIDECYIKALDNFAKDKATFLIDPDYCIHAVAIKIDDKKRILNWKYIHKLFMLDEAWTIAHDTEHHWLYARSHHRDMVALVMRMRGGPPQETLTRSSIHAA